MFTWQDLVVDVASCRRVACTPLRAEPLVPYIDVGNQPFWREGRLAMGWTVLH